MKKRGEGNGQPVADLPATDAAPALPDELPPPTPPPEDRTNLPVHVVRFGTVRACIWQVQTEFGPRHNVTVSRLYKGADGAWYNATTFSYRDLLALAKALDWAHSWIAEQIALHGADVPY